MPEKPDKTSHFSAYLGNLGGEKFMIRVLFVCHGNICRSPMAEFILKKLVKEQGIEERFEIASAATSREEIGNDIYPPAKKCLLGHNVPFSTRQARQITKQDLTYFDYIISMEDYNIGNLRRLLGNSDKYSLLLDYTDSPGNISDPWYSGDFETAYKEIEIGCKGLLKKIGD